MIGARARMLAATVLLALTAACSQNASQLPATPIAYAAAPARAALRPAHLTLRIKVPRKHRSRAHFVSPSTASLTYSIDGGTASSVNLSVSNPGCVVNGPIYYLICTVSTALPPGPHTLAVSTTDAPNGGGNVLSSTQEPIDFAPGTNNGVYFTLGGIAKSIDVLPVHAANVVAHTSTGYSVYGSTPFEVTIVAVDADGNHIIGPGATIPTVVATPAGMSFSTPPPASPTRWTLSSAFVATNPTVPSNVTLNVQATPVPNSGGTTVTRNVSFALYDPWIYVSDGSQIKAWDERGNFKNIGKFETNSAAGGMTYDSVDNLIYVCDNDHTAIRAYDALGQRQRTLTGAFGGLYQPIAILYDPHNQWLYSGMSSPNNGFYAYDNEGDQLVAPSGSLFANASYTRGIAYVPATGFLYVTDYTGTGATSVQTYDESG
ncbi:MAG: hypothetical protein JO199_10000, partial [Candidatus Eremiobacteraeota bacterium]|nr:hypothetical protein [Candidatus Eremiobacteraeota bacterium]